MKCFLLAALVTTPIAAVAGGDTIIPQLFQVTGVAADDVLNVRAGPSASEPALWVLAPNATGIEVIEFNTAGTWGKVGGGEGNGWVSLIYLIEQPWLGDGISPGMTCVGTEPFWGITFNGTTADYSDPLDDFPGLPLVSASGPYPPYTSFGFDATTPAGRVSGIIDVARCSDGMSERDFGWRVTMMHQGAEGSGLQHGCCSLQRR